MKDVIHVLAYGTLQEQFLNHKKIQVRSGQPMETIEKKVKIKGWELILSDHGTYPIAVPNPNRSIFGSILACTSKQIQDIVEIESDYLIKIIPVEVDDIWYNCLFFYGYKKNERPIRSGNFLNFARRHKLSCLNKK